MTAKSAQTALVTLFCPDRPGLVAAIAGVLFDMGANLGDTSFAVLGEAAEFSALCDVPADVRLQDIEVALTECPETSNGKVSVTPFSLAALHGPMARISHRIVLSGGDRPGLVARLAEVFEHYHANIVRLNTERVAEPDNTYRYMVRIAVNIPDETTAPCLATIANTAGELGLTCSWTAA